MLLESFVSTQKQSVQKAMAKKFKRYISYKQDFFELIMAALQVHMSLTPLQLPSPPSSQPPALSTYIIDPSARIVPTSC